MLIDRVESDYNDCVLHQSFMSCEEVLGKLLDEAFWEAREKGPHYNKHVCKENEPYTGEEDHTGRIKFPYMSYRRYLGNAESLADSGHVRTKQTDDGSVFGWKSHFRKIPNQIHMKFKRSSLTDADGNPLYEYVAYKPVFSSETVSQEIHGTRLYYYKITDRMIFSYGLSRNPSEDFPYDGEFGPNELTEDCAVRVNEELLTEANRQQLLQKSRNAQDYKDQSKGRNRYERRNKSSISATVRDYNMIQMDPLFKRDILEFRIPVIGETDVYVVDVRVDGLLEEVRKQVMRNKGRLEFKVILQSLMKVLNVGNVYLGCSCPDFKYRQRYWATRNGYVAGGAETRPSDKTNPNDTLGAGCKHVMLVLANLDWAVKVSSVINNYIKYCREHLESNYAEYIFPKIYGVKYDRAVQMNLFDTGLLPDDEATVKAAIEAGMRGKDERGRFSPGNDMRFRRKELVEPDGDGGQLRLDLSQGEEETESGGADGNGQ